MSSHDGVQEIPAEDELVLNVLLNCELTKSSQTKQAHFQSLPTTPLEIKKKIEEDFSIPSCVQTLHYQSMILKDSDQLHHIHFRSGDTFTVDYPIEAECEMVQNVIKWLKELLEVLKPVEKNVTSPDEENDLLMSSTFEKIRNLVLQGLSNGATIALSLTLFFPLKDKTLINRYYFQQEGGLDVLMKVYSILVSKAWKEFGENHVFLEQVCTLAVRNYAHTLPLLRQVVQLGGMEMCIVTLLRRNLQGKYGIDPLDYRTISYAEYGTDPLEYRTMSYALYALKNFSELPECQVPLAMRTDIIDQILALAVHHTNEYSTARVSANMIQCLTQSPDVHIYIARKEIVENMLVICERKQKLKIISEQSSLSNQGLKEHPMVVNALRCYTGIALAQVALGSPPLLTDSIPPHLLHKILNLMSDVLKSASPAEIRQYEEKERDLVWGTFLPYLQYLYKPSPIKDSTTEDKGNLYITSCNVLLHFLENALGRVIHREVLVKEGLLDYTMCLPAVLPVECQPRARFLVNELGKHMQLQPPSLCTLAKAHIAKTFCGLQPIMEMNSIGEFLHNFHSFLC